MGCMSKSAELKTVGEVSQLLGVSVRTLHYWEERGLVSPSGRTCSEYRLYGEGDIVKLQQIMVYRATGMGLSHIAQLLAGEEDKVSHLRRQRRLLMDKHAELEGMLRALDNLLEDAMGRDALTVEEVAEILEDSRFPAYQEEAQKRWGDSEDWKVSSQRQKSMSAQDWDDLKKRSVALEAAFAQAMQAGAQPNSAQAHELAEAHRAMLSTFYPVTLSKQVILAGGYVADRRFKEYYEGLHPGLTQWLKEAIESNAAAKGVDPETAQWV